jgi:hypothetical protein
MYDFNFIIDEAFLSMYSFTKHPVILDKRDCCRNKILEYGKGLEVLSTKVLEL